MGTEFIPILTEIIEGVTEIWQEIDGPVLLVLRAFTGILTGNLRAGFNIIKGAIDLVAGVLTGDFSRAWQGVQQIAQGVMNQIINVYNNTIALIPGVSKIDMVAFADNMEVAEEASEDLAGSLSGDSGLSGTVKDVTQSLVGATGATQALTTFTNAVIFGAEKLQIYQDRNAELRERFEELHPELVQATTDVENYTAALDSANDLVDEWADTLVALDRDKAQRRRDDAADREKEEEGREKEAEKEEERAEREADKAEKDRERAAEKAEADRERERQRQERHNEKLEREAERHAEKLADIRQKAADDAVAAHEEFNETIADIESDYRDATTDAASQFRDDIQDAESDYSDTIIQIAEDRAESGIRIEEDYVQTVTDIWEAWQQSRDDLLETWNRRLEDNIERHRDALADLGVRWHTF